MEEWQGREGSQYWFVNGQMTAVSSGVPSRRGPPGDPRTPCRFAPRRSQEAETFTHHCLRAAVKGVNSPTLGLPPWSLANSQSLRLVAAGLCGNSGCRGNMRNPSEAPRGFRWNPSASAQPTRHSMIVSCFTLSSFPRLPGRTLMCSSLTYLSVVPETTRPLPRLCLDLVVIFPEWPPLPPNPLPLYLKYPGFLTRYSLQPSPSQVLKPSLNPCP